MAETLGSKAVGSIVKIKVNGTLRDWIVVQQGRPSDMYDESCDGTWLLMKDCYEKRQWHSLEIIDYAESAIHEYLNNTFINLFDDKIKAVIKHVKIPYRPGNKPSMDVNSGENGLSVKVFLLSCYETGWTNNFNTGEYFPEDGAWLSYYYGTTATDTKRIAYLDGSATLWWVRSPQARYSSGVGGVYSNGSFTHASPRNSNAIRPAMIMPANLQVDNNGVVFTNQPPSAPGSINVPSAVKGGASLSISWASASDPDGNLSGYRLERSVNGGGWTQVYQGAALSCTDSITYGWNTVAYRVRAYDAVGEVSGYVTSPTRSVFNNVAPTKPGSIAVPDGIKGGTAITISWAASTDSNSNLAGYKLERSVNAGGWSQIFEGTALSYRDNITYGWQSVAYRVRAYDTEGAASDYMAGPTRYVFNNSAPTAPSTITVPESATGGKTLLVTWGAASDVDGNLAGYKLERSVGGGAWQQLYAGTERSYTDTITRGWTNVIYRVRAYDAEGVHSGYTTGSTCTVVSNTAPAISGADGGLGEKNAPFTQAYTVTDAEGDAITVTERLDGAIWRTYEAVPNTENVFSVDAAAYQKLLNGTHTITVTAADQYAGGALSGVRTWTFTKNVAALSVRLQQPMPAATMPGKCIVNVTGMIPSGAAYKVEVCNNGNDEVPVWEDCTEAVRSGAKYFFTNTVKAAESWGVNVRVTVERLGAAGDCYITGIGGNFE